MSQKFVTETYVSWLKDPEVTKFLQSRDQSLKELSAYVAHRECDPNVRFWAIVSNETSAHIGNVKLEPIDWSAKSAVFGMLLGDRAYWGRGIGSEVTRLVVEHAFEGLGLEKIELGVEKDNAAAIRVYEKAGFRVVPHPKSKDAKWMINERRLT